MTEKNSDAFANIEFQLDWASEYAAHTEIYYGQKVNFWRDIFPDGVKKILINQSKSEKTQFMLAPGQLVPKYNSSKVFDIKSKQFCNSLLADASDPKIGRFYPKGLLKGLPNVFKDNITPFRCTKNAPCIKADLNHPLAEKELRLTTMMHNVWEKSSDKGGACKNWGEVISDGPGMQARWNGKPTDFFSGRAFARQDESPDSRFYTKPRLVQHIDQNAIKIISQLYGRLIRPEAKVLDLMSSWTSHLPSDLCLKQLTGLGMNAVEMAQNPVLTDHIVHDLNKTPFLPFDDNTYDAVICTVSVEYLSQPFKIFKEAGRVLRPGGVFIVSFSNRWFPTKAIRIWPHLHEFERMGLVLEYFIKSGSFKKIASYSMRGLPRPETDKYYGEFIYSDPVYGVWGFAS